MEEKKDTESYIQIIFVKVNLKIVMWKKEKPKQNIKISDITQIFRKGTDLKVRR